jgi:rare lipoprotein A
MKYLFVACCFIISLTACESVPEPQTSQNKANTYKTVPPKASNGTSRYSVDQDFSPDILLDPKNIQDAIPRQEYVTKAGNKSPYTVLGKTYYVLPSAKGYKDKGGASWYGLKFHGHQTSNGEIYDIYAMTAAHKTLPIPCYVKVTNLENGLTAIVRVNDRGPFHEGRIIDLSYAAATKLGYIGKGTAQVMVEAIDVGQASAPVNATYQSEKVYANQQASSVEAGYVYLQVGAYLDASIAIDVQKKLAVNYADTVQVESGIDRYFRVRIGPVAETDVDRITNHLLQQGYPKPMRVR